MIPPKTLLVAIAAGLASALLFAGLLFQANAVFGLAFTAPIPIAIAGLGWGPVAGFIAVLVAGGTLTALGGSAFGGFLYILALGGPAAFGAYLLGLARPADEDASVRPFPQSGKEALVWYPLGRVLYALALWVVVACVLIGLLVGYDPAALVPELMSVLPAPTSDDVGEQEFRAFAETMVRLIPLVQPAILTVLLVVCLYLAGVVTRISGRLPRPKDDIPSSVTLPRTAVFVTLGGSALALAGGSAGLVGTVVAGTFTTVFALAGLAALHRRSRGRPGRGLILFASYASILLLTFPIVVFTVIGLIESWRGSETSHGSPS